MSDFLGVGWAFPVELDARRRFALARHERDIEQAIQMILLTPPGQRVMRPTFGCQIHELIFAPNDSTTAGLAAYYVQDALVMWEPRIEVTDVQVEIDPDNQERMLITISYDIKATHDSRSLVFPFYHIPGE
jgi:phage baseplate assembly protein W